MLSAPPLLRPVFSSYPTHDTAKNSQDTAPGSECEKGPLTSLWDQADVPQRN